MKKEYEMPVAEKVQFNYSEQVVASPDGEECFEKWSQPRGTGCNTTFGGYFGN